MKKARFAGRVSARMPLLAALLAVVPLTFTACPTEVSVPATPELLSVIPGDGKLIVTWSRVEGAAAYEVFVGIINNTSNAQTGQANDIAQQSGAAITADITQYRVGAEMLTIDNGQPYYVWVRAKNSAGTSGFSAPLSAAPVPPPASAPVISGVTAGDGQLTVAWGAVANAAAYEVWYGTGSEPAAATKWPADISGTSVTITGLANGTACNVWVKAKNGAGTSGFSAVSAQTPAEQTVAAPTGLVVDPGDGKLTVQWNKVENTPSYTVASYEVYYDTDDNSEGAAKLPGDIPQPASGSTVSAQITGLTNDTTYYVWVRTKTAANPGTLSAFSASAFGAPSTGDVTGTPTAPTSVTVSTAGNRSLTVSWAGATNAASYDLYFSTSSTLGTPGLDSTNSKQDITATFITIGGVNEMTLANGTVYHVWVRAANASGDKSAWSTVSASGTPVLSAPTGLAARSHHKRLSVSWNRVPNATAYRLWINTADDPATAVEYGTAARWWKSGDATNNPAAHSGDITPWSYELSGTVYSKFTERLDRHGNAGQAIIPYTLEGVDAAQDLPDAVQPPTPTASNVVKSLVWLDNTTYYLWVQALDGTITAGNPPDDDNGSDWSDPAPSFTENPAGSSVKSAALQAAPTAYQPKSSISGFNDYVGVWYMEKPYYPAALAPNNAAGFYAGDQITAHKYYGGATVIPRLEDARYGWSMEIFADGTLYFVGEIPCSHPVISQDGFGYPTIYIWTRIDNAAKTVSGLGALPDIYFWGSDYAEFAPAASADPDFHPATSQSVPSPDVLMIGVDREKAGYDWDEFSTIHGWIGAALTDGKSASGNTYIAAVASTTTNITASTLETKGANLPADIRTVEDGVWHIFCMEDSALLHAIDGVWVNPVKQAAAAAGN